MALDEKEYLLADDLQCLRSVLQAVGNTVIFVRNLPTQINKSDVDVATLYVYTDEVTSLGI